MIEGELQRLEQTSRLKVKPMQCKTMKEAKNCMINHYPSGTNRPKQKMVNMRLSRSEIQWDQNVRRHAMSLSWKKDQYCTEQLGR